MKKIINLNEGMQNRVNRNVKHYKNDLLIDFDTIKKKYKNNATRFVWITRKNGTNLGLYNDVSINDTETNITVEFYLKNDESTSFYDINIDSIKDGIIYGSIEKISKDTIISMLK